MRCVPAWHCVSVRKAIGEVVQQPEQAHRVDDVVLSVPEQELMGATTLRQQSNLALQWDRRNSTDAIFDLPLASATPPEKFAKQRAPTPPTESDALWRKFQKVLHPVQAQSDDSLHEDWDCEHHFGPMVLSILIVRRSLST